MGQQESSEDRKHRHKKRPSIHSGTLYSSNYSKTSKEKSATKSNSDIPRRHMHFIDTSADFHNSASELKEALPEDLKVYSNSIEVMYRFWCSEIETLKPQRFKETAVLFYMTVFDLLPGAHKLFQKNIELQATQFFGMFRWLITSLKQPDPQRLIKKIRVLGKMHQKMGIKQEWYASFLLAFNNTMTKTAEERYTLRTKYAMEQLYTLVMNIMLNRDFKSLSSDSIAHLLHNLGKLEDCLMDAKASEFLELYMKQQFCGELILFYKDHRRFKACVDEIQRQRIGQEILKRYLDDDSECEVNVSYVNRNGVYRTLEINHKMFTEGIFDVCCKECVELIRGNIWSGFKRETLKMAVDADIAYEKDIASRSAMNLYDQYID